MSAAPWRVSKAGAIRALLLQQFPDRTVPRGVYPQLARQFGSTRSYVSQVAEGAAFSVEGNEA